MKFYLMFLSMSVFGAMSSVMADEPTETTTTQEVAVADADDTKAEAPKEQTPACGRCRGR